MKYVICFSQSGFRLGDYQKEKDDILPMASSFLKDCNGRAVRVDVYKDDDMDQISARVYFNTCGEDKYTKSAFFYKGCDKKLEKEIKEWEL